MFTLKKPNMHSYQKIKSCSLYRYFSWILRQLSNNLPSIKTLFIMLLLSSSLVPLSVNIWRRQWHPTPVLLPGKSHGRRSLVGCSPWGRWGSDTTERLHFWFFTFMYWRRKWQPTPVFLPGESQGQGSLVGCHLWGHTESDMTEVT